MFYFLLVLEDVPCSKGTSEFVYLSESTSDSGVVLKALSNGPIGVIRRTQWLDIIITVISTSLAKMLSNFTITKWREAVGTSVAITILIHAWTYRPEPIIVGAINCLIRHAIVTGIRLSFAKLVPSFTIAK